MIWAQISLDDSLNEPSGNCSLKVNGVIQQPTATGSSSSPEQRT
jgi:hypothetical protein